MGVFFVCILMQQLQNQLLTVKETASLLKLNPITIYGYIRDGSLIASKFGRYYRIAQSDVQKFIETHKVNSTTIYA
jgi:excisionase family DNA binding protein